MSDQHTRVAPQPTPTAPFPVFQSARGPFSETHPTYTTPEEQSTDGVEYDEAGNEYRFNTPPA